VQGSRTQAPGAGSTLDSCWVRGVRVVRAGAPTNVDLLALRRVISAAQADYRDPEVGTRSRTGGVGV